jgi:hypothetical protein
MPFLLLLIGAVLIIAAFNNAQGDLATELETDVPAFLKWGLAVVGVGALGWIPGMQLISRWLLALVLVVIVLKNYTQIIAGFQAFSPSSGAQTAQQVQANPTPATAYAANPNNPQVTQAEISGTGTGTGATGQLAQGGAIAGNINALSQQPSLATSPFGVFDPTSFLASFEAGFGGFGGIA